jgi:hypothetical protein
MEGQRGERLTTSRKKLGYCTKQIMIKGMYSAIRYMAVTELYESK